MISRSSSKILLYLIAVIFLLAAFFKCNRFFFCDSTYEFDLDYLEERDDAYVVNCFNLRRGSFNLIIEYETDEDVTGYVQADNDKSFDISMSADEDSVSVPFSLTHPTDRFKINMPRITDSGDQSGIQIDKICLVSGRLPIYTDSLLYAFIFATIGTLIFILGRKWEGITTSDRKAILALALMILVVNIPYYQKGLGFTADIRAHMQRIEGVMRGLMDRQFPVIVSPNFMNEFGEISFMYPDIFLYPFGILRILSVSMLTVYRLCMLCVNAVTVLIAYLSFRLMSSNRLLVLLATFVITFEPYRLYNMLGRGSGAGNAIASAFLPLVMAGVYLILKGDKRWWVLSLGMTGVIESHVLTLLILIFILIVIGFLSARDLIRDGKYKHLLKAAGLTLAMNMGFLVIFMKCYMTDWSSEALEWSDFAAAAYGSADAFTNTWSLFEIMAFATCVILLIRAGNKGSIGYRLALAMAGVGFFLYLTTLKVFPWRYIMAASVSVERLTMMLQVAQRVYALSSVLFICCIVILIEEEGMMSGILQRHGRRFNISAAIVITLFGSMMIYGTVYAFADYYCASYLMPDEVYGDHNSLPIKDYIPTGVSDETWARDAGSVSDEDAVESLYYAKSGTHIDYNYISHEEETYANMPLLYYEWYRAEDETGAPLSVRKSEDGRVVVELIGDGEQHGAHVHFEMGLGYSLLYDLSLVFSLMCIWRIWKKRSWIAG